MIVNFNPCAGSPCQNGGECSHAIHAYDETETVDSPSFVFTSLLIRHDASCHCRQGFTGKYCQLRQDPCSPNPCQAGGTCEGEDSISYALVLQIVKVNSANSIKLMLVIMILVKMVGHVRQHWKEDSSVCVGQGTEELTVNWLQNLANQTPA